MTFQRFYFFVGTVAELIKVAPVMQEISRRGFETKIIASGQNDIGSSSALSLSGKSRVDILLNDRPIKKSPLALLSWCISTMLRASRALRREFAGKGKETVLIVHGDTVSTLMGAIIGKRFGLTVAHVEAGLRSFDFLHPFPEEIDRYLTGFLADISFCPGEAAVHNLRNRRGKTVNTHFNTNIDSLELALAQRGGQSDESSSTNTPYFIFIMHRQENLLNARLVRSVISCVLEAAVTMRCVFVMHDLTKSVLSGLNILDEVMTNPNIVTVGRIPYFSFIKTLQVSQYIITDGGGNQQESFYLGKPCLLLRTVTEGPEGIGSNVIVSGNDVGVIRRFMSEYQTYRRPSIRPPTSPSAIVADALTQ